MKCQNLFFGLNKKNIINLSSAEFAERVVMVQIYIGRMDGDNTRQFNETPRNWFATVF